VVVGVLLGGPGGGPDPPARLVALLVLGVRTFGGVICESG